MRVEDDSKDFKIVLQDAGEIARMAMAIGLYKHTVQNAGYGGTLIPKRVLELLEEALTNGEMLNEY